MKGVVVLDFDGTIADAESALLKIYGPLAEKHNWPKLTRKDYYRLKNGSPREALRWANVKIWQLPKLVRIGRSEYKKHIQDIKLFGGSHELLDKLAQNGDVFILSSNERETVRQILDNNNIKAKVNIMRGSPLFGKHKALKKLLKRSHYSASDSWMIGDEIRDIEAGKKAGMKTIGVSWGLQSEEGIKKANPDHIAKKPDDILEFIYNKD